VITPELKKYLDSLKARPVLPSDEAVRRAMLSVGWGEDDIREGLLYLRTRNTAFAGGNQPYGNSAFSPRSVFSPDVSSPPDHTSINTTATRPSANSTFLTRAVNGIRPLSQNIPLQNRQKDIVSSAPDHALTDRQSKSVGEEEGDAKSNPNSAVVSEPRPTPPRIFAKPVGAPIPSFGLGERQTIRTEPNPQTSPNMSGLQRAILPQQNFQAPQTPLTPTPPFFSSENSSSVEKEHTILRAQTEDYERMAPGTSVSVKSIEPQFGKLKFVPPPRFGGPGHAAPGARLQRAMAGIVIGAVIIIGIVAAIFYAQIEGIGPFARPAKTGGADVIQP